MTLEQSLEITLGEFRRGASLAGFVPVAVQSSRGEIPLRYHPASGSACTLLLADGGGWDSPGRGSLYPRLSRELPAAGVAVLRLAYRRPGEVEECVLDALAGLHFLAAEGASRFAVVGHGFGAVVAAQAAANSEAMAAVVALAGQSERLAAVSSLPAGCAALFVHGTEDRVQPLSASHGGYALAREPRYLRVFAGAGHGFDEVTDELASELFGWLLGELG